jgi:hypothetical protein
MISDEDYFQELILKKIITENIPKIISWKKIITENFQELIYCWKFV